MDDGEKRNRLVRAGWRFRSSGRCKVAGCFALVEYWQDAHKNVSIRDYIGFGPHWVSCKGETKRQKKKAAQIELFPRGN
jgi:hypothetical protein